MAKSSNVMARVEPEIKEQAESILSQLGLPVSVLINSLYRQIIMRGGVPFSMTVPSHAISRDTMIPRFPVGSSCLPAVCRIRSSTGCVVGQSEASRQSA